MYTAETADESSDCLRYSCSGSESESPMLYKGRHAKSEKVGAAGGGGGSVVGRDG